MTPEQFSSLKTGDIVRGKSSTTACIVTAKYADRATAVDTFDITNPDEWDLIFIANHQPVEQEVDQRHEERPPRELPPATPEDLMQNDDAIEAVNQCDVILELCDDIPEAGEDYAASVSEKVDSIRDDCEAR